MTTVTTPSSLALMPSLETAWQDVDSSFERFCLTAGIGGIEPMLCGEATHLSGPPPRPGGAPCCRPYMSSVAPAGGGGRGLAGPLGDEPDADQRIDAQTQARCAAAQ